MKKVVLIFLSFITFSCIYAQDANLEAKVLYNKAEEAYNAGKYSEALKDLFDVEGMLGVTNSRILYLKANTYNNMVKQDWTNAVRLRATLNQFFQITDQSKYPQEKYMDMVNLSVDLKTLEANYENDFTAVKNSNNLNTINKYCQTYPKSAHAEELKPIIASLQAKAQQQEKSQHSAEVRSMYMGTYKKKLSSGIAQTVVAGVFIPAGIGMLAGAGSLEQRYTVTDPYTGQTYSGTDVSAEEIVCYTLGALTLTGGIVLGITGPITIKNAMVLKRKMKREEANVSFYPMMQPHLMAFGGGVKIKF